MIAKRQSGDFCVMTVTSGSQLNRKTQKSRRSHSILRDSYLMKKRILTAREIARHDDGVTVIVKLTAGIIVLRSSLNPQHRKIRKLLDRIGIVGIGTDGAIDIMHDVLEMRIEEFLRPGYTRGDVWGNELGKYLIRVLGEFFFTRPHDGKGMAIFPAYAFLFEVGHPVYGNFVELITFDGKAESRLPPIVVFFPKTGKRLSALAEKIGSVIQQTLEAIPKDRKVELAEVVFALVGNVAKAIRASLNAPFFECVYLDAFVAANRDFKRVWNFVDVEKAIAVASRPPATSDVEPSAVSDVEPPQSPE